MALIIILMLSGCGMNEVRLPGDGAFVVTHVYLMTLGHGFRAHVCPMIDGYEDIDLAPEQETYLETNKGTSVYIRTSSQPNREAPLPGEGRLAGRRLCSGGLKIACAATLHNWIRSRKRPACGKAGRFAFRSSGPAPLSSRLEDAGLQLPIFASRQTGTKPAGAALSTTDLHNRMSPVRPSTIQRPSWVVKPSKAIAGERWPFPAPRD